VTTEDDFQNALDANPEDHQTRLVFADWLQERNDPRAEGIRALGVLQKYPMISNSGGKPVYCWKRHDNERDPRSWTAEEWERSNPQHAVLPADVVLSFVASEIQFSFPSRREAEDTVAITFAALPPERRAELLAGAIGAEGS
jgi:uncharacterized protein (TIGR02996 family)